VAKFIQKTNNKFLSENLVYEEACKLNLNFLFAKNTMITENCAFQNYYCDFDVNFKINNKDLELIKQIYKESGYNIKNKNNENFFFNIAYAILKHYGKQTLKEVCDFLKKFGIIDITKENVKISLNRTPILIDYQSYVRMNKND
jgi:hypothetical protein